MEIQLRILVSRALKKGSLALTTDRRDQMVLDRRNKSRARWETLSRRELEDAIEAVGVCEGSIESETHLGWKVGGCCCLAVSCEAVKVEEVKLLRGKERPSEISTSTLLEGGGCHMIISERQVAFMIPLEHSTHAHVISTCFRRTLR